jgi:hypothetical protein
VNLGLIFGHLSQQQQQQQGVTTVSTCLCFMESGDVVVGDDAGDKKHGQISKTF